MKHKPSSEPSRLSRPSGREAMPRFIGATRRSTTGKDSKKLLDYIK